MARIRGFNEFNRNLDRMYNEYREEHDKMVKRAGQIVVRNVRLRTPVDTGELRQKVKSKVVGKTKVVIYNNTPYARHVEYGTTHFAGFHFMKRGINASKEQVRKMVDRTMSRVMR